MLKSVRNIIIVISLVILGIWLFFKITDLEIEKRTGIDIEEVENSRIEIFDNETTITIGDSGVIEVEEIIKMKLGKTQNNVPEISLALYNNDPFISEYNRVGPFDETISLNGNKMNEANYEFNDTDVKLLNFDYTNKNEHTIVINYKYNVSEYIKEYRNGAVLRLIPNSEYKNYNVKIIIPEETTNFSLQNNRVKYYNITKKIDNTTYLINLSDVTYTHDLELILDKGIINNVKSIDEDKQIYEEFDYETEAIIRLIKYALFIMLIEIICLFIIILIDKKNKVQKEYVRDTKDVINPILAEAIIDRKIGARELIMSCIANLINKGNLECINNDTVKLIHYKNISSYESRILKLIFNEDNKTISFKDLSKIFKKSNSKTSKFYECFKNIKQDIEKELVNKNIFDKFGERLFKYIRIILCMFYASIFYLIYLIIARSSILLYEELLFANIIGFIIGNIKENTFIKKFIDDMKKDIGWVFFKGSLIFICVIILTCIPNAIINLFKTSTYTVVFSLDIILLIINTILMRKANNHLLTPEGRKEYQKAYGLKSYIEDYSLMKERELDSNILWDDYLTYAIAFGISNKVTDRFDEELMNVNITLQKIDKFLRF